jgi:lipopolysaccharide transport system permease protein
MSAQAKWRDELSVVNGRRDLTWERLRADIAPIFTRHVTWRALAAGDIRSKYRRTFLGPWWITATNASTALIMGVVAGHYLSADMKTYLPNFMVSMTIWAFISASLTESCHTMISAGGMIKAVDMPIIIHVMRMVQRNLIILLHNSAVIPIIWMIYPWPLGPGTLLVVPGLMIVYVFVAAISTILSIVCVRYRDIPPVVTSLVQVLFFISPIIWTPAQTGTNPIFVTLNPIAYMLAVTRNPIMGTPTSLHDWIGALFVISVLSAAALYIYTRYRARVVYWA